MAKVQTTSLKSDIPLNPSSVSTGSSATQYKTIYTATEAVSWVFNCIWNGGSWNFALKVNSTTKSTEAYWFTINLSLNAWDKINVEYSTPWSNVSYSFEFKSDLIAPFRTDAKWNPRSLEVINIWSKEIITIFGIHTDNKFKNYLPPVSIWGFINYCKSYWTAHSNSTTNYTMKWYWYVQWWIKTDNGTNLPAVNINWVRINSNWYATSYFRLTEGFYTVEPGDVITAWSNVTVVDYY